MKREIQSLSEKDKDCSENSELDCIYAPLTDQQLDQIYQQIAKKFHAERIKQNMTVIQLEARTGIDRTAIYRMENCRRRFGFGNMIRMCHALGLSLDDLYQASVDCNKNGEASV